MCGIIGMVTDAVNGFTSTDMDWFEEALIVDSLRGPDSTGVFVVTNKNHVRVAKQASHPYHFLASKEWSSTRAAAFSSGKIMVGHNRKATKGSINSANAHPFAEKHIVLVHNGTIYNQKDLTAEETEVDSHAICHSLVEKGYKETLKSIDGAFALVWYDMKERCLYLVRNSQRPLGYIATHSGLYFASELPMLEWSLRRAKNYTSSMTFKDKDEIKAGTLVKIRFENGYFKPESEEVAFKSYVVVGGTTYSSFPHGQQHFPYQWHGALADCGDEDYGCGARNLEDDEDVTKAVNDSVSITPKKEFASVDPLLGEYEFGAEVVFIPDSDQSYGTNTNRFAILGSAYAVGKPVVPAKFWAPTSWSDDQIAAVLGAHKCTAIIRSVYKGFNNQPGVYLGDVEVEPTGVKDQLGNQIPWKEFKQIVDTHVCDECGQELDLKSADFHELTPLDNCTLYHVKCADCVTQPQPKQKTQMVEEAVTE